MQKGHIFPSDLTLDNIFSRDFSKTFNRVVNSGNFLTIPLMREMLGRLVLCMSKTNTNNKPRFFRNRDIFIP